ncbi:MAG TPA: nuclear transport factor 2 family protein [Candidatus Binataceae bacterium]|nr:nuclear transport factor 2 family protein [Candidatus Binataceae bacterium]
MKKQARKPAKSIKKVSKKAAKKLAKRVAKAGSALEKRVRLLEDIEEISKLKARYCNYVDGGWDRPTHDYDGVASIFVEDGVWEAVPTIRAETREGIRDYFKQAQNISLAFHRISNPIIEVDGDQATGNWHVLVALTQPNGRAVWIGGIYNDDFVRTPEGWKFQKLGFTFAFNVPYEKGWGPGDWYLNNTVGGQPAQGESSSPGGNGPGAPAE